jgi:hypothetical protein
MDAEVAPSEPSHLPSEIDSLQIVGQGSNKTDARRQVEHCPQAGNAVGHLPSGVPQPWQDLQTLTLESTRLPR